MKRWPVMAGWGLLIMVAGGLLWCGIGAGEWPTRWLDQAQLPQPGWLLWWGLLAVTIAAGGCGIPPVVFILPAASLWTFPGALLFSLLGGMGGSLLGFFLARYFLRETLTARIPLKIRKFEQRLEAHALLTVLGLRLLFYLFPPVNWMLGLSRISLGRFSLGTFFGMLPGTLLLLSTGRGLTGMLV